MLRFLPVVIHLILLLNLIYPIRLLQVTWCHAAYDAELAKQRHSCSVTLLLWQLSLVFNHVGLQSKQLCLFHLTVKHCFLPEGGF